VRRLVFVDAGVPPCGGEATTSAEFLDHLRSLAPDGAGVERGHRTLRIVGKGNKPATVPLVPRTARTIDLAVGERHEGPILRRRDGHRLDRRTAHRWVRAIGKRAGLGNVHPHMLRAAFIMAALDAGVPLRDVQIAARHADPRTTTIYDRRRQNFDRHAAYVVVAFVAGG
jgi:integrase/recombinase XerD